LTSRRSPEHVYLSLPLKDTAPLCLRHAGLCPKMHTPHVLMCDDAALAMMLPDIATRLVVVTILRDRGVLFSSCFSHHSHASHATFLVYLRQRTCTPTCRNS
jgi:hypothetical protein